MTVALDALSPIQVAFYARMTGDATLLALLGHNARGNGVYDGAPEGALFPYIELGEAVETPRNTLRELGAETVATLHVWSKQRGYAEGLRVVARLRVLFDHQPLVVSGHQVVSVKHEQTLTLRDPNPELRHLPVRFRITTEQE